MLLGYMSDQQKPRIKPVSRTTQSMYSRIRQCRCFPEIDRRIRLGWSTTDCANAIQTEFNELTETSVKYLKKLLDRYRSQIPAAELSVSSANTLISRLATKRVAEGLDELAEIEKLYMVQLQRMEIDIANERTGNKLLDTTAQEMHVAMKLIKMSADLKMDLGLVKRQMGTVEITGKLAADASERYGKDSVGKMIADGDTRKKVLAIAERLLLSAAKAGVDSAIVMNSIPDPNPDVKSEIIDAESTENQNEIGSDD